jgi:lysophospholipase L1-like esterase
MASFAVLAGLTIASATSRDTPLPSGRPVSVAAAATPTSAERGTRPPPSARAVLRYVALGDSYTIGTATRSDRDRWPNQLVARLGKEPPTLELVANLGVNGFTSRDLIEVELPQLDLFRPEFLSLLIGVNDVVQGVPESTFRANATAILDALGRRVPADRIIVVATPDYTVTPQGGAYGDPARQSAGVRGNNDILHELATARGIVYVDTYDLSLRARDDRTLVADDGLHPSGAQYGLWVDLVAPVVERLIGR